jgi:tetratricopeptide (TPR) repeat protein
MPRHPLIWHAFQRCDCSLPGRFPIEVAAAVLATDEDSPAGSDEALRVVAGLVDKSLLLRVETSVATRPMYQMLETVRAFAALEMAAAGERHQAMEGLARYCTGEASGIASDLMAFWLMRGHLAEGLQWYEQILNLPSLPPAAESRALVGAALMCYTQGDLGRAAVGLGRAMAIARDAGEMEVVVTADNLLGHLETASGSLDTARERFARSIEAFREMAIPWGVGNALGGMALVALATGDTSQAERLLIEATAALRSTGPWFLTPVTNLRAILATQCGHFDEAIALVRENLTRIRELQDKFAFVYALVALAAAAVLKGDDAWAARILGAGDSVTERTGATVVDKPVQEVREQAERESRARLGPDRWARAYASGRSASIDSLLKDIDSGL